MLLTAFVWNKTNRTVAEKLGTRRSLLQEEEERYEGIRSATGSV
jgi:hypothetical protein